MGLWYKTFTHKKIDIIEVTLGVPFNINVVSRYKTWNEPHFCLAYSKYDGKLRTGRTSLYIEGTYPTFTVKATNTNYVNEATSKAYVLIIEKDMGYKYENLVTPDYSKPFVRQYALNNFEIYTLNSSNDFTLLLKKQPTYIKFFPSFKYLNLPLGMKSYYFNIQQVNTLSYKITPMIRWSNVWDRHTINGNGTLTLKDSSFVMTYNFVTYSNNGNIQPTNSTVTLKLNEAVHTHTLDVNQLFYHSSNTFRYGVTSKSASVYTNQIQNENCTFSVTATLGQNATKSTTIVMNQRVNTNYLAYTDCTLEVLVIYE